MHTHVCEAQALIMTRHVDFASTFTLAVITLHYCTQPHPADMHGSKQAEALEFKMRYCHVLLPQPAVVISWRR
jgi:hypothetical protein